MRSFSEWSGDLPGTARPGHCPGPPQKNGPLTQPGRVKRVARLTPFLLLAVLVLGTGLGIGVGLAEAGGGHRRGISVVLVLSHSRVTAGDDIKGWLVVNNPGPGRTLTDRHGRAVFFAVELGTSSYHQSIAFATICGSSGFSIPHGTSRTRVTIFTTFGACTTGGPADPSSSPRCLPDGRPPNLPAGKYDTYVAWNAPVPLPMAKPVLVTISPPKLKRTDPRRISCSPSWCSGRASGSGWGYRRHHQVRSR